MDGISAILLAAGESTRMGRLKALLPWQGVTLVEYQVQSIQQVGVSDVIVVVGHRGDEVAAKVEGWPGVTVVVNPDYQQGKTTSVKAGLRSLPHSTKAILFMAVDQPRPPHIIQAVIKAHIENDPLITSPVYQEHGGHPIMFSYSLLDELMNITEEGQGLKEVTVRHNDEIYALPVDNPIVRLDLNSPDDFQEAARVFASYLSSPIK